MYVIHDINKPCLYVHDPSSIPPLTAIKSDFEKVCEAVEELDEIAKRSQAALVAHLIANDAKADMYEESANPIATYIWDKTNVEVDVCTWSVKTDTHVVFLPDTLTQFVATFDAVRALITR